MLITNQNNEIYSLKQSEILVLFFFIYSFNLILLCCYLTVHNPSRIYEMVLGLKSEKQSIITFFIVLISLLSMAGVPPFAGFLGKLFLFINFFHQSISIVCILIFIGALFIYLYLRPGISLYKSTSPKYFILHNKLNKQSIFSFYLIILSSSLIFFNFLIMIFLI